MASDTVLSSVEPASSSKPAELARVLGLRDLIAIVLGTVIGSAIFIVPSSVLRSVGVRPGLAMGVWIVGGVLSLLGALTFGELGAMMPEAGGLYVYLRDAFGPFVAFLYGWTQFLVIASGSVAALGVASKDYLLALVPLTPGLVKVVPLLVIAVFTIINVWGTRKSAGLQVFGTSTKVGAVLIMAVLLFLAGRVHPTAPVVSVNTDVSGVALLGGAGLALVATLWAYEGWQYVTFSAGEARDPQRTFPMGIALGTAGVVGLYLLANVAYTHALGPLAVAGSTHVAADAMAAAYGPLASVAMIVVVEIAVCSALNSVVLTAPRVFFAMARDGLFFKRLGDVHPRFGTPAVAIIASSVWAMVLVLVASANYERLFTMVIGTGWVFYGASAATIFWYRRHRSDQARSFRVPGYPITPALFVLASVAVVVDVIVTKPADFAWCVAVVLIGAPAYLIWRGGRGQKA